MASMHRLKEALAQCASLIARSKNLLYWHPFLYRLRFERIYRHTKDHWSVLGDEVQSWLEDELVEMLPKPRFRRVLDVGCGKGLYTIRLCRESDDVVGVDVSWEAVREAQILWGARARFKQADISSDDLDGPYDLIVCQDVLCYIPSFKIKRAISALVGSLEERGYLLVRDHVNGEDAVSHRRHCALLEQELEPVYEKVAQRENVKFIYALFCKGSWASMEGIPQERASRCLLG